MYLPEINDVFDSQRPPAASCWPRRCSSERCPRLSGPAGSSHSCSGNATQLWPPATQHRTTATPPSVIVTMGCPTCLWAGLQVREKHISNANGSIYTAAIDTVQAACFSPEGGGRGRFTRVLALQRKAGGAERK